MKLTAANYAPHAHSTVSFGFNDSRGREIGAMITTTAFDVLEAPADATSYSCDSNDPCGWTVNSRRFWAAVHATRDGRTYGAGQSGKSFESEVERAAYIARRIADSRKAAAKKTAK